MDCIPGTWDAERPKKYEPISVSVSQPLIGSDLDLGCLGWGICRETVGSGILIDAKSSTTILACFGAKDPSATAVYAKIQHGTLARSRAYVQMVEIRLRLQIVHTNSTKIVHNDITT